MGASTWDPSSLPDLSGFIAIVTGGHTGLGFGTTIELAKHGATVYIASRSKAKVNEAISTIKTKEPDAKLRFLELDLMDLESVKRAAETFLQQETKLHILVNNAGIMCPPYTETKQGFESQIGVNYFAPFLLTKLLLPTLISTAQTSPKGTVRIVNLSSLGHAKLAPKEGIRFQDINMKSASPWPRYGQSKLTILLHAKEIARRYGEKGIVAVSLHPGTVKTGLPNGPLKSTPFYRFILPLVELGAPGPEKGAYTTLWCAASPELKTSVNGGYFTPIGKKTSPSEKGQDSLLARKLWDWTEEKLDALGY